MIPKTQPNIILKDLYKAFERRCFSKEATIPELKDSFFSLGKISFREGQGDVFCYRSEQLAENLLDRGNQSLGAIFLDELIKIHLRSGNFNAAEDIIFRVLNLSANSKDKIHVLARLTDLEKIYKKQNRRRDLFWVLDEKKRCAKDIIANYDEVSKNFQSIHRNPTTLNDIKIQLAYVYSDLAQMLERNRPKDSIKLIEKALEIYQEIGRQESIKYLTVKLERMRARHGIQPECL